jgi:osmoprotectant transport system permease protein
MFLLFCLFFQLGRADSAVVVGSKSFSESVILAELASQWLEAHDIPVERKFNLGNTGIVAEALFQNNISFYPEYSGTLKESLLKIHSEEDYEKSLSEKKLMVTGSLGFENTYALAITKKLADRLSLRKISDLRNHPELKVGISHEFANREDGWPGLRQRYSLQFKAPSTMAHALSYEAIRTGSLDVIDVYTTDPLIDKLNLLVLKDDLNYFPKYDALYVGLKDFGQSSGKVWSLLKQLESQITVDEMIQLNKAVDLEKKDLSATVEQFLKSRKLGFSKKETGNSQSSEFFMRLKEHLGLSLWSTLFAFLVGMPMGYLAYKIRNLGEIFSLFSALVQTIPSLALLCLLIPVFGIGDFPSYISLFLYALLPIVLNSQLGFQQISQSHHEVSFALGLNLRKKFLWVEFPMAFPLILNGLHQATISTIGTATLASFIGAGGLGAYISSGLATNDLTLVMKGAVPVTLLALLFHLIFVLLKKFSNLQKSR